MKLQEVFAYNLKSQHILNESWDTLNESQRLYLGKAERELWPLMEQLCKVFEAELTPQEIQTIFGAAETHASETGNNRTALGKAGDIAKLPVELMKKVNKQVDDLGKAAQKTGPVKFMDKKFEELKKQIGTDDGTIVQGVKFISDWAKENPGKASLAVAILTAAAAFATGPGGGAAVGFLLKGTKGLLKGDSLSSATGGAAKMAAVGAGIGALGDAIGALLPGDIANTFINDASGEIDVTQLSAMDATSLADIDASAANELVQSQNAMSELMRSTDLEADAKEILQGQLEQVNAKIIELNGGGNVVDGIDNMQAEFDIEGTGADIEKTTSGQELDGSEIDTTEVTAELSASDLDGMGINSADFPDNEWLTQNTQKFLDAGMTQDQIDALQNVQGFDRALAQKEFLGVDISTDMESAMSTDNIKVDGIPADIEVGETFKSTTSITLPDGTVYSGSATTEISGVDASGNAVYKLVDVQIATNPVSAELAKALDALPEELADELNDNVFTTVASGSMETTVDNTTANIVKAAAALGIGAGLAKADLKSQAPKEPAQSEFDFSKKDTKEEAYKRDLHRMLAEVDPSRLDLEDPKYQQDPKSGTQIELGLDNPNTMGAKAKRGLGAAGKWAKDKVAGGVAGVKQGMKDAGNKVTANKLNKAWKKAGSKTDTGSVVNVLSGAGLSNDDIASIGTTTKVDLPPPTSTSTDPDGVKDSQGTDNKIPNGTTADGSDGKKYTQSGGAWLNGTTKATPEIAKELDDQVAEPDPEDIEGTDAEAEAGTEAGTPISKGTKIKEPESQREFTADGNGGWIQAGGTPLKSDDPMHQKVDAIAGAKSDTSAEPEADPIKADPTKYTGKEPEAGTDAGATPTAGTDAGATPTGAEAGAGATPTAGTDKNVSNLANEITKAGAGEEVKAQLQSNGAGAGAGGEVNLQQLASDVADAGVQEIVRKQLSQK